MMWTMRFQVMTLILYAFISAQGLIFWLDYRQDKAEQKAIRASYLSIPMKALSEIEVKI